MTKPNPTMPGSTRDTPAEIHAKALAARADRRAARQAEGERLLELEIAAAATAAVRVRHAGRWRYADASARRGGRHHRRFWRACAVLRQQFALARDTRLRRGDCAAQSLIPRS
jgi:hypothetical protein